MFIKGLFYSVVEIRCPKFSCFYGATILDCCNQCSRVTVMLKIKLCLVESCMIDDLFTQYVCQLVWVQHTIPHSTHSTACDDHSYSCTDSKFPG